MDIKPVEYTLSLSKALENNSYSGSVESMRMICEDVLGYKKIAEHSTGDEIKINIRSLKTETLKEKSWLSKPNTTLTPEIRNIKIREICRHYSNNSPIKPEGIINTVLYEVDDNVPKLFSGHKMLPTFPPTNILGYGERWWDVGEPIGKMSCIYEHLKLPSYIFLVNKIPLDKFVEKVRQI